MNAVWYKQKTMRGGGMLLMNRINFICFFLIILLLTGCGGSGMEDTKMNYNVFDDVPGTAWNKLSEKTIYFGHHSVGANIIDGVKALVAENPNLKLSIIETSDPAEIEPGVLAHSTVGENENPNTKIDDFATKIQEGVGKHADMAFFKLCFVDVNADTNALKLFNYYKDNMTSLKKSYPDVVFIHCTVPLLKKEKKSFFSWVKGLFGKNGGFFDNQHNEMRNKYNQLLRDEYHGKAPILDIATAQSTRTDGTRETFKMNGETYYSLVPAYTEDGGHLNEEGQRHVAKHFLLSLVNCVR